ncbi:MAG: mechanosensitive ion channel family protein [Rhodobacteraceae bacterium]|nr:mechanosensitive ion channel family protein [Paracoccaceae bacterium]
MTFPHMVRLCAFWVLFTLASTVLLFAQQQDAQVDYGVWDGFATRIETTVDDGTASDDVLLALRADVVGWRQSFQAVVNGDMSRINSLRDQITALGPAPAEGEAEQAEIAAKRAELTEALDRLLAPLRTAEAALSRADGIVGQIDGLLRARQADQLLNMGPWPLNPVHWPVATNELSSAFSVLRQGVRRALQNPFRIQAAQNNLPLVIGLIIVGLVLLFEGRRRTEALALRLSKSQLRGPRPGFLGFLVSLGQILVPMLGIIILVWAVEATELYGLAARHILNTLPEITFVILISLWLGGRIFAATPEIETPIGLPAEQKREGRIYTAALGVIYAAVIFFNHLGDYFKFSPEASATISFPFIIVSAIMLFRLGQLLGKNDADAATLSSDSDYRNDVIRALGRAAIVVALIAPVLAALGYRAAATNLIYPTLMTLALFGFLALLQEAIRDAYAFVARTDGARDGLIPALIGFALLLGSVPLLALIWGARSTDLTEYYETARAGFQIGDTTISPGSLLTLLIVFLIGYFLTRALQRGLKTSVLPKTNLDAGGQVAVVSGLGYVGFFLAALVAITSAGIDLSNIAIVAGALSVGIGFGLQNIVSNFVSGIILLIERPIAEGDWIEVNGNMGYVRDISVRSTRIETFDRSDVIVPNADLVSGTVTNYTRGNTVGRLIVPVGVAYGTDTRKVETILREIAEAQPMVLMNPPPSVQFVGLGASSLDFEIRAILRDVNWILNVKTNILHQVVERFTAEGIEIPFAQTDLWLRNPETLAGPSTKGEPK